jgi:hypothetical protein
MHTYLLINELIEIKYSALNYVTFPTLGAHTVAMFE